MRFSIVDVLRGSFAEKTIVLPGGYPFAGASPENDFSRARRGAFVGSCTAYDYRLGRLYVLFLEQSAARWDLHRVAFARINEEVAGRDSPWVRAVRAYVRVAALGDYGAEKRALEQLAGSADAPLAADIARHFATPTAAKSEDDLLRLYAQATTDEGRRTCLEALARHGGPETTRIFRALLHAQPVPPWAIGPACRWAAQQHATSELPSLLGLLASPDRRTQWYAVAPVAALAEAGDAEALEPILAALDDGTATSFYREAAGFAGQPAAIRDIRRRLGDNYRKTPDLTLLLVAWGDADVVRWAAHDGLGPGRRRWVAAYVLARSPLPEADQPLRAIVAGNDSELKAALIDGLAESARTDRLALVRTILTSCSVNRRVTNAAHRALRRMTADGVAGAEALLGVLPAETAESY